MRLFVAIEFPHQVQEEFLQAQTLLRNTASTGNFTRPENFHLTMAFLGEVPPNREAEARKAMKEIPWAPFQLVFDRLGSFQRGGEGLWWIGAEKEPALMEAQSALCHCLQKEGFRLEDRAFFPHLTLARRVTMNPHMAPPKLPQPILVQVEHISLMESRREQGKLTYIRRFLR